MCPNDSKFLESHGWHYLGSRSDLFTLRKTLRSSPQVGHFGFAARVEEAIIHDDYPNVAAPPMTEGSKSGR